jgi:hypothetical protein
LVKRARIHSRDLQPQIATPKALFAAARVQRFDWPENLPTTAIDEIGRKLHVGTTQETPDVTVTVEAFDVSHNTFSYLTGYTPGTFPFSGASVTEFKNVDIIGQIKDGNTSSTNILSALYVKRAIVTGMDASFGVTANSSVTYTFGASNKKEFKSPVFYDNFTVAASGVTLSHTPTWLPRTSGYTIDAYVTGVNGTAYMDEGTDYTVAGTAVTLLNPTVGDVVWFTYCSTFTPVTFLGLDDVAPAAIQGKYVPLTISVSKIPRVQSATIRAAFNAEKILEMGGLGKPVGYEANTPNVTGDISVLKTDTDLINLVTGQSLTSIEGDMEYAVTNLPLKIQLKNPANPNQTLLTYYVPSITFTSESDSSQVNQSMQQTFGWESATGELFVISGAGPY